MGRPPAQAAIQVKQLRANSVNTLMVAVKGLAVAAAVALFGDKSDFHTF